LGHLVSYRVCPRTGNMPFTRPHRAWLIRVAGSDVGNVFKPQFLQVGL
jgi:hypothetical protein